MPRIILPIITVVIASLMLAYSNILSTIVTPHLLDVKYHTLSEPAQKQVKCLAENIYFESAHEPDQGKMAVAFVTLNRTRHKDFPSTVCEVVTQKTKSTCQFSWFCIVKDKIPRNDEIYSKILDMASFVYVNYEKIDDPTLGALYYHADYVNPRWKNLNHTTTIGRHIFYVPKTKDI
ncbi:MAG: hypothetical protein RLY61_14 [Candidatus Parcubacteria bacterium]|jgi:spore germination cell wall hydrolase CwlJ-like protein